MVPERKPRLELTWIGKEERRAPLEPRILLEDLSRSYGAPSPDGLSDNRLIFGDNLLALKALEAEFAGKVKCCYADPPFNTGAMLEHYEDGLEHSIWLQQMSERLDLIRTLLRSDGYIFIHLDDHEMHYCKVLMDRIFGRSNFVNNIVLSTNKPFGFKGTSEGIFKQAQHILFYARDKAQIGLNHDALLVEKGYDAQYKWVIDDIARPETAWTWRNIKDVVATELGYASQKRAQAALGDGFLAEVASFAIQNAERVFRTAAISGGALAKRKETVARSRKIKDKICRHPNDDMDYRFIGGERMLFYRERLQEVDGQLLPVEAVTDIWTDIPVEGLAAEGGVDFPKGKKPEKLIERILI